MAYKNYEDQLKYQRQWYQRFKKERLRQVYQRKLAIRAWLDDYKKEIKCNTCGENHPACIDFHHHNGNEKIDNIPQMVNRGFSIERIKKEITKCTPLCANCHRKEHWNLDATNRYKRKERLKNLEPISFKDPNRKPRSRRCEKIKLNCFVCGEEIIKRKKLYEWEKKRGQQKIMCSRRCVGLYCKQFFPKHQISKELVEKIKEGFKLGWSGYKIAKKYGLNKQTVYNHRAVV